MRTRSSKTRWSIGFLVILAIISGSAGYYHYKTLQSSKNNETPIETSTIRTGDIILSATGPGTLIPGKEVSFGFKNRGQISEVLVNLGDQVEAGQVLARLESTTLDLKYKQAEADLAALSSPATIAEAEQAVQDAKQSFASARDDLQHLIGPDLLIAEENISAAQHEVQLAKAAAQSGSSNENKQKVTNAEAKLAKAQEALTWAQQESANRYIPQTFTYTIRNDNGVTVRKELIAPTDVEVSSARAAYELAKANLADAQNYLDILQGNKTADDVPASSAASITEAQIALDQAKADLDATGLVAPISGTITSIELNTGDMVGTSPVVTISNMTQPYTIDVYLDETDWDKAKIGFDATVTFDLLPNNNYPGKITQVYPALDDSSGTSMVHILVQLNDKINVDLPAGATASVDVTGGKALGAVLVPTSALKETEPGKYIVYLMQNGKPVEHEVEIGIQDILNAEVKSGLQPGDIVVMNAATISN